MTLFFGCALDEADVPKSAAVANVGGRTRLVPCLDGGSGSGFDWVGGARTLSADFALRVLGLFGAPSSVERARLIEAGSTGGCASALACAFALPFWPRLCFGFGFWSRLCFRSPPLSRFLLCLGLLLSLLVARIPCPPFGFASESAVLPILLSPHWP